VLGLGIDEPDEDEDAQIEVDGVPFIAEEDFLGKHGKTFDLSFNENKEVKLTAVTA